MKFAIFLILFLLSSSFSFASVESDINLLKKEIVSLKERVKKLEAKNSPFGVQDMKGNSLSKDQALKNSKITPVQKQNMLKQLNEARKNIMNYLRERDKILKEIDEEADL